MLLLALLLSMARGYYFLGMLSKVAGKGRVARVGSKVKSDGSVWVHIELFANFWVKYINITFYIVILPF